ncbi:hypothetical protein C8R46DRAFT_1355532 [Mycena filopes]|nr:hypothetical protein C8R46DRAFT_1355532 [Mycena filopes]
MKILLPPELQREIFETAIRTSHAARGNAEVKLNLSLVAHHVHLWVDSVFYRAVTICRSRSATRFLTLVDSKPADFFANAVKVLSVESGIPEKKLVRILHACRGVESLAIWWTKYGGSPPSLVSGFPLLRRLSLITRDIAYTVDDVRPSSLSTLTHLDLAYSLHLRHISDLPEILKQLPGLTHVSLGSWSSPVAHAQLVIETCTALQVLRMLVTPREFEIGEITETYSFDLRIVVATIVYSGHRDWMSPYLGLGDPWTSAEHVVAERAARKAEQVLNSKLEQLGIE